ncbi:hypothetical protein EX30DRAFT_365979 [Ascodesmis nigricans]|uniref:Uncharacterized protein n=1 Tax=Ascodesmis nigricans TaxID=341454 RepID=A0A4S2MMZ4_9PEZI|nr:hypothetical protein EX30DRAFT_365979 [Ascodesmis nigricans]
MTQENSIYLTSPPIPGDILWLPSPDPTNTLDPRQLNRPAVVLYVLPSGQVWFLTMTSFGRRRLEEKFPGKHPYSVDRRRRYIAVAPTPPHPDTKHRIIPIVSGDPVTETLNTTSYIKLIQPVCAHWRVLGELWGGTMRVNGRTVILLRRCAKKYAVDNEHVLRGLETADEIHMMERERCQRANNAARQANSAQKTLVVVGEEEMPVTRRVEEPTSPRSLVGQQESESMFSLKWLMRWIEVSGARVAVYLKRRIFGNLLRMMGRSA